MKTIEELAREAGLCITTFDNLMPGKRPELARIEFAENGIAELTRFAALVRTEALEEAAKVCEARIVEVTSEVNGDLGERYYRDCVQDAIKIIRALKERT